MDTYDIMLIKLDQRMQKAVDLQAVLTKYGCIVSMRLGMHEAGDQCSNQGLILLQLVGEKKQIKEFERDLNKVEGVTCKLVTI